MAPFGHRRNLRFSSSPEKSHPGRPGHGRNTYKLCRTKHCSVRYNKRLVAIELIKRFYPLIVDALNSAASCTVTRTRGNQAKHWWTEELQQLKARSIESHRMWKDANRPRTGLLYEVYKRDKYSYKLQIKAEKSLSELTVTSDLHDALCNKDVNGFWNTWNSKLNVKRDKPKVVAGLADPAEIADGFATYFANTCKPNSAAKHDQLRTEFTNKCVNYSGNYLPQTIFFTVELLSIIVSNLKTGRAAGFDGLTAEHLIHSHPAALLLIIYMCNLILLSGMYL